MSKDCELCGGSGSRIVIINDKWTGRKKTATLECLCSKSAFISECVEFPTLSWLGDAYLPPSKIDPDLVFDPKNLAESPNYIFYGADYYDFCLHVKSVIIRHRTKIDYPAMRCCSSISILTDFFVKQSDGTSRKLEEVNNFDLLVMTLDTQQKNDALKTVVAQVVYSRLRKRVPTWLYVPTPTLTEVNLEYSDELMKYLEEKEVGTDVRRFTKKKLIPIAGVNVEKKQSVSQQTAANYGRD